MAVAGARFDLVQAVAVSLLLGGALDLSPFTGTVDVSRLQLPHWGVGLLHTFPNEGSAHGRVVIHPHEYVPRRSRFARADAEVRLVEGHRRAVPLRDQPGAGVPHGRQPRRCRDRGQRRHGARRQGVG